MHHYRLSPRCVAGLAVVIGSVIGFISCWSGAARSAPIPKAKTRVEFRIVANQKDDGPAIKTAQEWFAEAKDNAARKAELQTLAEKGAPPPVPIPRGETTPRYGWVEVGPAALEMVGLDPWMEKIEDYKAFIQKAAKARENGEAILMERFNADRQVLVWSRPCQNKELKKEDRQRKKTDVFILTRIPEAQRAVTARHLTAVKVVEGEAGLRLHINLNNDGGDRLGKMTEKNVRRDMIVAVDGRVVAMAIIAEAVRKDVAISGKFTRTELDALADQIRKDLPK